MINSKQLGLFNKYLNFAAVILIRTRTYTCHKTRHYLHTYTEKMHINRYIIYSDGYMQFLMLKKV